LLPVHVANNYIATSECTKCRGKQITTAFEVFGGKPHIVGNALGIRIEEYQRQKHDVKQTIRMTQDKIQSQHPLPLHK
jgi:hypothetical protein